jgi:GNAT superfamily N-acetyltransferase
VPVSVTPVVSRRELKEFVELPFRLHSSHPAWIPPLRIERHAFLSRRFNAFFRHGEARYFLARRDGRVVGRISAHVDHAFNAHHGNRWGMFGFFECEDDREAAAALLDAARAWLRSRGRDVLVGPMDFSMNDESGIVIEGHDREPFIRQPWHPPYYQRLCEEAGLEKAVDLLTWEIEIGDRDSIKPVIRDLDRRAREEHGITVRNMTRRTLRRDLEAFAEVYNAAWSQNWGFVPYSKEDLDAYALELQLVFDERWFMVAETRDGEVAGVAISPLDVNQVLQRMDGRLLPLGWWRFLTGRRHIDRVRVGFLGVHPDHQHTGVAACFYMEHFNRADPERRGVWWAEMGWILEDNPINQGMAGLGGRIVKRFRVYRDDLL